MNNALRYGALLTLPLCIGLAGCAGIGQNRFGAGWYGADGYRRVLRHRGRFQREGSRQEKPHRIGSALTVRGHRNGHRDFLRLHPGRDGRRHRDFVGRGIVSQNPEYRTQES